MSGDSYDPMNQPDDEQINQAVRLAAAFVANGDIRLERGQKSPLPADQLAELIHDLYAMLDEAKVKILNKVLRDADDLRDAVARREENQQAHK